MKQQPTAMETLRGNTRKRQCGLTQGIQIDMFCQFFFLLWLFLSRDSETGRKREKRFTLNLGTTYLHLQSYL